MKLKMTKTVMTWLTGMAAASALFTSCSDEESDKMIWEATAIPAENVTAVYNPAYYQQVQITSNGEAGEVTLKCTNYSTLTIIGVPNAEGEYENSECRYSASVTAPGTVKIIFYKMPDNFTQILAALRIDGREGDDANSTNVSITRKP